MEGIPGFVGPVWRSAVDHLLEFGILLALLVAGAIAYYFIRVARHGEGASSFNSARRYVFPARLYRHGSTRVDMGHYLVNAILLSPFTGAVLVVVLSIFSADALGAVLIDAFGQNPPRLTNPTVVVALQVTTLVIGAELGMYVAHLLLHKIPILWSLHRVHHSAESLTIFTRVRNHPVDTLFLIPLRFVFAGAFGGAFVFATGTTIEPMTVAIYAPLLTLLPYGPDILRHTHVPVSFGSLDYVYNSPVMHQIHHSAELRHRDKNLGGELMIFDWLFGTLYVPRNDGEYRWGLNEEECGEANPHRTLVRFYFEPFAHGWRLLKAKGWRAFLPERDIFYEDGSSGDGIVGSRRESRSVHGGGLSAEAP